MNPKYYYIPKIINGISKTLSITQNGINIYEAAKPIFNNSKNIFNKLREFSNIKQINKKEINKKTTINNSSNFNNPSFFK